MTRSSQFRRLARPAVAVFLLIAGGALGVLLIFSPAATDPAARSVLQALGGVILGASLGVATTWLYARRADADLRAMEAGLIGRLEQQLVTARTTQEAMTRVVEDLMVSFETTRSLSSVTARSLLNSGHDLDATNFDRADLSGVKVSAIRARALTFRGADVSRSSWYDCAIPGAQFTEAEMTASSFAACDLRGASLGRGVAIKLKNCRLDEALINGGSRSLSLRGGNSFSGLQLRDGSVTLENEVFEEAPVHAWGIGEANWDDWFEDGLRADVIDAGAIRTAIRFGLGSFAVSAGLFRACDISTGLGVRLTFRRCLFDDTAVTGSGRVVAYQDCVATRSPQSELPEGVSLWQDLAFEDQFRWWHEVWDERGSRPEDPPGGR